MTPIVHMSSLYKKALRRIFTYLQILFVKKLLYNVTYLQRIVITSYDKNDLLKM